MKRRNFLNGLMVGAAALGTSVAVRPLRTWAQVAAANTSPASRSLSIGYRTIDVMGRSAQVFAWFGRMADRDLRWRLEPTSTCRYRAPSTSRR